MSNWPRYDAGTAFLTVKPRLASDFAKRIRGDLAAKNITFNATATPVLSSTFRKDLRDKLGKVNENVTVGAKLGSLSKFRADFRAQISKMSADVKVTPKLTGVAAFRTELKTRMNGLKQDVKITPTVSGIGAFKTDLRSKIQAAGKNVEIGVDLDFTQANAQLASWRAMVGAQPLSLNVNVDTSAAVAQLMALRTLASSIDWGSVGAGGSGGSGSGGRGRRNGMIRSIRVQMEVDRASVARAEAELAQASGRMQQSYRAQGDAAERVRLAQQRLNEVTANSNASASQRLAATQNLARAQRNLADRQGDVARGIARQAEAHRRLTQAQNDQNSISRLVRAGLAGIANTAMNLGSSLVSSIGPAGLLKGALIGLAAVSLVPLLGQLTQAAGVIALLPAMGAAAAASLATVVIGSTGIVDAFQAAGKASDDAAKNAEDNAKKQRDAARRVADAERDVGDAYENAAQSAKDGNRQIAQAERQVQDAQKRSKAAQEDLTRARKDALEQIEDLNLALKGSAIDEEDALIAVERARERLANLGRDGNPVSALDVREANNGLRQAYQRLDEVRERNNDLREETYDANKAGVEGSEQVVAAKEAVADATQSEADAQDNLARTHEQVARQTAQAQRQIEDALRRVADAQEAQAEALDSASESADKFSEAMAKLSPNAQDFVNKTRDLGGAWNDLRMSVQDGLFEGIGDKIQLLGNTYMPVLTTGLGGLADVLNTKLKSAMDWLTQDAQVSGIQTILTNTKEALGPLIDGLGNLGQILFDLAKVGSDFLPGMTGTFESTTQGWADTIREMSQVGEDGTSKLHGWIQTALDTLDKFWEIIKNIGSAIGSLFKGSDETGDSWLDSLEKGSEKLKNFLGSEEGQQKIRDFFADVKQTVADILKIVETTVRVLDGTKGLLEKNFPGLGDGGSGVIGAVSAAARGDGGGFLDSIKNTDGSAFSSVISALGGTVTPLTGGAINLGKRGWQWILGGGSGNDAPQELTDEQFQQLSPDEQRQYLESRGGGTFGRGRRGGSSGSDDPSAWAEKWTEFSDTVKSGWNNKVFPALQGVKDKAWEIGQGFVDDIKKRAGDAWNGLKNNVSTGWTTIQTTWQTLRTEGLGGLADDFASKITNGAVTSWEDLPAHIASGARTIIDEHFPWLGSALDGLQSKFQTVVDGIGSIWDGIKSKMATPINFVIETVYNNGILKFWNAIADKIGLKKLEEIPPIDTGGAGMGSAGFGKVKQYADGGVHGVMSGYSPGVDDRIIAVGGGEAIMRPEWTRAVGPDFVDNANAAAKSGGIAGAKRFMGFYANGGIVASMEDVVRKHFPMLLTNGAAFSGLRYTDNGHHSTGHAADFSNGGDAGTPEMKAFANFIADNYQQRTLELIHSPFERNIKNYDFVGNGMGMYGADTMAGHRNHVHWAVDGPISNDIDDPSLLQRAWGAITGAASTATSMFRDMAANLFEVPLNGLGSMIPDQFPGVGEFGKIPKALFNTMKGHLIDFVRGKAGEKDNASGAGGSGASMGAFGGSSMDYAKEIVAAAKERGLPAEAAAIGIATALVESNLRMYANNSVPDSLNYPYDLIGSDHDSIGLFQQRNNGAWGTTEQRMNPKASAGMFFDRMMQVGWEGKDRGAVAQSVQVSDYPLKYGQRMGEADAIVAQLYDAGGVIEPGKVAVNLSGKPEAVFTNDEWMILQEFMRLIGRPDFIEQLEAAKGLPVEPGGESAGGFASPYGTGKGTVAEGGYQLPTGNLTGDLRAFDKLHGTGGGSASGGTFGTQSYARGAAMRQSVNTFGDRAVDAGKQMISGLLPYDIFNPGGMLGGLINGGKYLIDWYSNPQNLADSAAYAAELQANPAAALSKIAGGFMADPNAPQSQQQAQVAPVDPGTVQQQVQGLAQNAPAPADGMTAQSGGDTYQFIVRDVDEAFRKYTQVQAKKAAGFIGR